MNLYRGDTNKPEVKDVAINKAFRYITTLALDRGQLIEQEPRIFQDDGDIYYDLHNTEDPMYVVINKEGFRLYKGTDLRFISHDGLAPQVIPISGGSLCLLDRYFNFDEDQLLLLKIFLLCAFIPKIQHPIILLEGPKQTGKTTIAKNLSSLIDPTKAEILTLPNDEKSLHLNLSQHYFVPYDNMFDVSQNISDNLCRAATGAGIEKRALFKDEDVIILKFKRAILISGIDLGTLREDLLSRCLTFHTTKIIRKDPKWTRNKMIDDFNEEKPLILGAIFDIISKAMSLVPEIDITPVSRMDDFEIWGYACAEVLEKGMGERFHKLFKQNINNQNQTMIDNNPLLTAIIYLMSFLFSCLVLSSSGRILYF